MVRSRSENSRVTPALPNKKSRSTRRECPMANPSAVAPYGATPDTERVEKASQVIDPSADE